MCNAFKLKADLKRLGAATKVRLGLPLILPLGVTAETSNLQIPKSVFPRRDGLILRPVDRDAPSDGLEPAVASWNPVLSLPESASERPAARSLLAARRHKRKLASLQDPDIPVLRLRAVIMVHKDAA
jgi:hypothetical protein